MTQDFPKVTIITVAYNSADTIKDTIESIVRQDYPKIEYIVIDGGSTDGTLPIVEKYSKHVSVLVSEPDKGLYDAMNKGLALATGDIVGFLNSDDFFSESDSLSSIISLMVHKNTDAVFSDLKIVDPHDLTKVLRYYNSGKFAPGKFRYGWMPAHPTFYAKLSVYKKAGLFSLDYKIAADFDLLIRILYSNKASFTYLPKPIVKMRGGGLSTSGWKQSLLLNREIVRACKSHGIYTCLPIVLLKLPFKLLELFKR